MKTFKILCPDVTPVNTRNTGVMLFPPVCLKLLPSFLHCSAQAQRHHWQIAALIIVPCCTGKRRMAVGFCFLSFYLSFLLSFFIPTLFSLCSLCLCSLHIWMLATLTWENNLLLVYLFFLTLQTLRELLYISCYNKQLIPKTCHHSPVTVTLIRKWIIETMVL